MNLYNLLKVKKTLTSYGYFVYRFIDYNGVILYIGRTENMNIRMKRHREIPTELYYTIRKIEYIELYDKEFMVLTEKYFISKYKPLCNKNDARHIFYENIYIDTLKWNIHACRCEKTIRKEMNLIQDNGLKIKFNLSELWMYITYAQLCHEGKYILYPLQAYSLNKYFSGRIKKAFEYCKKVLFDEISKNIKLNYKNLYTVIDSMELKITTNNIDIFFARKEIGLYLSIKQDGKEVENILVYINIEDIK